VNAQTLEHEAMGNQNLQNRQDDQKITSLGVDASITRKLPQLFNVLGEMN